MRRGSTACAIQETRETTSAVGAHRQPRSCGDVDEAVAAGAKALLDTARSPLKQGRHTWPQVLVDVDIQAPMTRDLRPGGGIMSVRRTPRPCPDERRERLTPRIWTADRRRLRLGDESDGTGSGPLRLLEGLAWTGVKDSGRGCSLSRVGYETLTRPKSFHLRTVTPASS